MELLLVEFCRAALYCKQLITFFSFETQQKLKFEVYDSDSSSSDLSAHDFLGRAFTTLGEIVGASSGSFTRNLLRDE